MESYVIDSRIHFSNNFRNLFDEPQLNSLSLRISYYLDNNSVKNWLGPKKRVQDTGFKKRDDKTGKSACLKNTGFKI
ncbi:DUF5916 domain-containing protein [Aequorivita capsosiphonis]|uniref:DUF5916 domain-containing protein n=1 Tax=Aequorivita capsosiphonis TaxID=487317 RepID=UPI000410D85B|nr:DUF5916 domain-containing protein [Aequorivita capsosiphonis]